MTAARRRPLPWWAELTALPLLNLMLALLLSGGVVLMTGADPVAAVAALVRGAFGGAEAWGYTLYYATDMIFAGLAVAVAFHAGLFNIGVEGQAYLGGLGAALVGLHAGGVPPWISVPAAVASAALFGAAWAAIPALLQAQRGSHIVITTIMFNFVAYALMTYLIAGPLIAPGQMDPGTRAFPGVALPQIGGTPLNAAFPLALVCLALTYVLLWHTPAGYRLRAVGAAPRAAVYAGMVPGRVILWAMLLSGALAGGVAANEVLGAQHKLLIGFTNGYGFTGIAVALMGRNHPAGILPAAILFGALYQGGAEMAFDIPRISSDLVVVIQGLVILTTGAAPFLLRPLLARLLHPLGAGR